MTNETNAIPADTNEPTEAEMAAFNDFSVHDVPPNFSVVGNPLERVHEPTLEALSPSDRTAVLERAGSNKPEAIQSALHEFLLGRRRDLLIKAGPGEDATETQKIMLEQANRVRQLNTDIERIDAQLADVLRYETVRNDDGTVAAVPVYRLQGDSRSAYEAERERRVYEMTLIAGVQGDREIREANRADALKARAMQAQIEEQREITRRAEEMAREERLNHAAGTRAKFLSSNIG